MWKMDLESWKDLAKSALTVPAVAVWLSAWWVNTAYIWGQVLGSIQRILETSPILEQIYDLLTWLELVELFI